MHRNIVWFINPEDSWAENRGDRPPLGLAYLSAYLKQHSHKTRIFDFNHEGITIKDVIEAKPDFVCITIATPNYNRAMEIANKIREFKAKYPRIFSGKLKLIAGGNHVAAYPNEPKTLKSYDHIVAGHGDGERALLDIVEGKTKEQIVNAPFMQDLDDLPFPDYDALNMESYNLTIDGVKAMTISGSRGCIYCFDEKTEILTENGWKLFKDLNNERVATVNKNDKSFEWQYPTDYIKSFYRGKMLYINSQNVNQLLTPNHNLFTCHDLTNDLKKWRLQEVSKLNKYFRSCALKGAYSTYLDINYIEIPGLGEIKMDDWLEFFGYYISEGSAWIGKKSPKWTSGQSYNVRIYQFKPDSKIKMRECMKRLGMNVWNVGNGLSIKNKELCLYLKNFGNECYFKFIPKEFKNLSIRQLKILLNALLLGDGSIIYNCKNGQTTYATTSKLLIDDIQEILVKIGNGSRINITKPRYVKQPNGKIILSKILYKITVSNRKYSIFEKKHINEQDYEGFVYCVSVPNHLIVIRRNNIVSVSGNSCFYCGSSTIKKVRNHSAKYIARHMKLLYDKYNVRGFYFVDDIFTNNFRKVSELCGLIKEIFPLKDIKIRATTRANLLTQELCYVMKDAGFEIMSIGLESGSDKVLKAMQKIETVEVQRRGVEYCYKAGIKVKGFFIIGNPQETWEDILMTINFAKDLAEKGMMQYADCYILNPVPASQFWQNPEKFGIEAIKPKDSNWNDYYQIGTNREIKVNIKHPYLTEEQLKEGIKLFYETVKIPGMTK